MKKVVASLAVLASIIFSSNILHAQTVIGTDFVAPTGDYVVLESDAGVDIQGGGVLIQAHGAGTMLLSTDGQNDIDLISDGNTVLWPQTEGYQVIMYGDSTVVGSEHGLQLQPYGTQPTCDAYREGTLYYAKASTGIAGALNLCVGNDDGSFTWQTK